MKVLVDLYGPSTSVRDVMLCSTCLRVVARIGTAPGSWDGPEPELFAYASRPDTWRGAHHIRDSSLDRSVEQGCYICNPLLDAFPRQVRDRSRYSRTFYEIQPKGHQRWALRFTIELPAPAQVIECYGSFKILPKNVLSAPPRMLRLTDSTFSDSCKRQIEIWLSHCTTAHSACNEDWRTTNKYFIRLLNVNDANIRLEEFAPSTCPNKYATLSHCWSHTSSGSVSQLTTANSSYLRDGFAESSLPREFQHATQIARWMGVKYLWIDALCIIQDSVDDWREQSNVMGEIYAGSHCNIAAMNQSGDDGFLRQRQLKIIEPFLIRDPESHSCSTTHVIGYDDFWCNSLLSNPLHNRAWVLQERQLSPRTIHFGEQIFWECREHKACEAYPTGIPEEFSNRRTKAWRQGEQVFNPRSKVHADRSQQSWLGVESALLPMRTRLFSQQEAGEYWSSTVERYMECELSRVADKLIAIQGLANKVHDTTGQRYLAGLWDGPDLAQGLLWYTPARQQGNGQPSVKFPPGDMKGNRAPSWSWASVDANIVWKWPAQCGKPLVQINETIIHSPSDGVSGVTHPPLMRISGILLAMRLRIMNNHEDGSPNEDGSYDCDVLPEQTSFDGESLEMLSNALSCSDPTILFDEALAPSREIDVHLLPVVTEWRGRLGHPAAEVAGLILKRHGSDTRIVYERIGIFCFDNLLADDGLPGGAGNSLQAAFAQGRTERIALI